MHQLHIKSTFLPLAAGDLNDREKDEALESLMFLKEKRDGSVKGKACVNGQKQRLGSSKEDATLPTVLLKAVLITSVIDTYEGIEVEIVDMPGSFLTFDQDEVINMTIKGKLAEVIVKTTPEVYQNYIAIEKGEMVLYVQILKAIYGCLCSALLLYRKLMDDLESIGLELNPCNTCVVKNMIDGKQFTIT